MRCKNLPKYRRCFYLIALLLLTASAVIAVPVSSLHLPEHRNDSLSSPLQIAGRFPKSPYRAHPKSASLIRLNNGWLGRLESFDIMLPIPIASTAITLFYEKIMSSVLNIWHSDPESAMLRITMDDLVLEMTSTAQIKIPWNVVFHFAMAMRSATERGLAAGRYKGFFAHPAMGIDVGVHIMMGVQQVARAA